MGGRPEWDYEWDYTKGLPTLPPLRQGASGTYNVTLVSDGLRLETNSITTTNSYVFYIFSDADNTKIVSDVGVIEAKMRCRFRGSNNGGYGVLRLSNGTDGVNVLFNNGKVRLWDASGAGYGTQISTYTSNTWYVVRIELDNGVGRVYINDVLVKDNIDASTMYYTSSSVFGAQNFREYTYHYAEFEYVKLKVGRL